MRKETLRALSLLLAALMLSLSALPASAATSATASAIQLVKTTGAVTVTNSAGRSLTTWDNMRLYNGYRIQTGWQSYAWINLDNSKLTKLDASSKVEIRQSGRKLELLLTSGNLFFNVTNPLEKSETLNIRTSTTLMGIRGTAGWIKVVDRWTTEIYVLEGTVTCSATDPVTGQIKTTVVESGEKAVATAYPQDQEGDKCDIIRERFEPDNIDGFVLEELAQDPGLCGDIFEKSGMDPLPPVGLLESARRQLEDISEELDSVREELEGENPSVEDAQARLDDLQQRLAELKEQLEGLGTEDDVQRNLDDAQEHLEQAQEALDGGNVQGALDSLDGARKDLEDAHQGHADGAQQTGEDTARKRLEQDEQTMQDEQNRIEGELTEQDSSVSTDTVWTDPEPGSNPGTPDDGNTTPDPAPGDTVELTMPVTASDIQAELDKDDVAAVAVKPGDGSDSLMVDMDLTVPGGKNLTIENGIDVVVMDGFSLVVNGTMEVMGDLDNNGDITVDGTLYADGGMVNLGALTVNGTMSVGGNIFNGLIGTITVNSSNTLRVNRTIVSEGTIINAPTGRIVADTITTTHTLNNAGRIDGAVTQTDGTFTMSGGTIDGGSRPAISVSGGTADISGGAALKSTAPTSIIQITGTPAVTWNGTAVTADSILTTIRDGDTYQLANMSADIEMALDNAKDGEIVTLPKDCTITGALYTSGGKEADPVVLDLNGYTLSVRNGWEHSGALRICDSSSTGVGTVIISNDTFSVFSYLCLDSGTISGTVSVEGGTFTMYDGSTIEGTVTLEGAASFTMEGGLINGGTSTAVSVGDGNSKFTINGGEVTSSTEYGSGFASANPIAAVSFFDWPNLNLNGGTITNGGVGFALFGIGIDGDHPEDPIKCTIRAKIIWHFLASSIDDDYLDAILMSGYTSTAEPDEDGYYYLADEDGNIIGLAEKANIFLDYVLRSVTLSAHPFTDIPDNAWYSDSVRYVHEQGLMNGTKDGVFSPNEPASRAMLVTILHRLEGLPSAGGGAFKDVPENAWYSDAVAWAGENGIVTGYGNGKFGPDDPLTREQMAAILYRYAGYKGYTTESLGDASAFPDGDTVSAYAEDAVSWAIGNGLLQGTGKQLAPAGGATRAQSATVLMRFCEDAAHSCSMAVVSALDVMCEPSGVFFLEDGSFLVTDTYNNVIWMVTDGAATVYAGGDTVSDPYDRPLGGYNDAGLMDSYFSSPWAIAPFLDGYAVTDADNNVVRLIREETTHTVNGSTEEELTVTDLGVAFNHPTGLAADGDGNLYVSDTFEGAVRVITPEGNVSTLIDGLADPMGLCWMDGTLYIAETGANRIVKVTDGILTVVAGSGEDGLVDGAAAQAAFSSPQGVAVGEDGTIYVSDTVNSAVRRIKNGIVTTLAHRDAADPESFIPTSPAGLAVCGGQFYICDSFARKVFVISLVR